MCLILPDINTKPLIAKKDIIVYKVGKAGVEYKYFNLFKRYWFRPYIYSTFKYIKNKKNPIVELKPIKEGIKYVINKGYHAYFTYSRAYNMKTYNSVISLFKIPKSSLYFKGTDCDIVSNQMIYLGTVQNLQVRCL